MQKRFLDPGDAAGDFHDELLVVCPRCEACARVIPKEPATANWSSPRRLVCSACGLAKDREVRRVVVGGACDFYFELPLWLTIPCCGETLWAYNARHLQLIEDFVAADLRESRPSTAGWSNRSVANRLPKWMKDRKNREEIGKAIARLREWRLDPIQGG